MTDETPTPDDDGDGDLVTSIAKLGLADDFELKVLETVPDRRFARSIVKKFRELNGEVDKLRRLLAKHERRIAVISLARRGMGTNEIAKALSIPPQQISKVLRSWRDEHQDIIDGRAQLHSVDIHRRPNARKGNHYAVEIEAMKSGVPPERVFEEQLQQNKALSSSTRDEPVEKVDTGSVDRLTALLDDEGFADLAAAFEEDERNAKTAKRSNGS